MVDGTFRAGSLRLLLGLVPLLAGAAMQQPADNARASVGGPQAKGDESARPHLHPLPGLPHLHKLEADPLQSRVQSRPHRLSLARHAPEGGLHQCHTSLVFKNVSTHCADCHADIHRRQFGANCESCHSVKGWQVSLKEIQQSPESFSADRRACSAAMRSTATRTQQPGSSQACRPPATPAIRRTFRLRSLITSRLASRRPARPATPLNTWFNAKFDHLRIHRLRADRRTCHAAVHGLPPATTCFKGTPATCYACHTTDFAEQQESAPCAAWTSPTTAPPATQRSNWLNAKFDHALYANYPLTGAHATVTCAQCHVNNNYVTTPTACYSLPPGRLHRDHQSESRRSRLPDRLLALPHHQRLDSSHLRSLHRPLPAHRRAYYR